jgi:LuxR family maltose regulon positive regulatory protein
LIDRLGSAAEPVATFVCAPAGAGKTLLLADWVDPSTTAWVALDADDNDDRRFFAAVLDALASCPAVPAGHPVHDLAVPHAPSADSAFLTDLVDTIVGLPEGVRLVLDDVHELTEVDPLRGLAALLWHEPCAARLVLASRHDLALPLDRLRAGGSLVELRGAELRFTDDEAAALFLAAEVDIAPEDRHALVERSEGWAACLGLAAHALHATDDPARLLAEFPGRRPMTDYLIEEVLNHLPEDTRELLRTISVCERVSGKLATTLSGRADAGIVLTGLARDAALVSGTGLPGRGFRLWAPVRAQLLADLSRQSPRRAAVLHTTAADWCAANDEPAAALEHASLAEDVDRVAALLRRYAIELALSGEYRVLDRAIQVLGDEFVADDATVALVAALTELERGDVPAADRLLARAEANRRGIRTGEAEILLRMVRSCRAQAAGDLDSLLSAVDSLADAAPRPMLATLVTLHRGTALLVSGQRTTAGKRLKGALAVARAAGQDYLVTRCLTALAGLAAEEGDFRRMTAWASEADTALAAHGWQETFGGAATRVLLGYGALLAADPEECVRQVGLAEPVLATVPPSADHALRLVAATLRGTAEFGMGDWAAGLRRIHEARVATAGIRLPAAQLALCAVLEHRAAVLLGLRDAGREVLSWAQEWVPGTAEVAVLRARAQLALGRHELAVATVQPVLATDALPALLPWTVVDGWVVATEAALRVGDRARALRGLTRALAVAGPMDALFPLVFAAPEVAELLAASYGQDRLACRVVAARTALGAAPAPVPLTERERAVLCLLPTLHSFDEIAQDLTVSVNTVKTHVRAIYTKLGVGKRRDAVLAAVDRGLLDPADANAAAGADVRA